MTRKKRSVIVPVYNEASRLSSPIDLIKNAVKALTDSYEIIIAEDGSTDGTEIVAKRIADNDPSIKLLSFRKRLGRGRALKNAFNIAEGEILIYLDADLATDLEALEALLKSVEKNKSLSTGSRLIMGSVVKRPISRIIASKAYNLLIRLLFRDEVHDHQCGFKAFHRELLQKILGDVESDGWFWDTEIIVRARKKGFEVSEVPIRWTEPRMNIKTDKSKVNLFLDSIEMAKKALKLRLKLSHLSRR